MGLSGPLPLVLALMTGLAAFATWRLWPMLELSLWLLGGIAAVLVALWVVSGGPAMLRRLGWRALLAGGNLVLATVLMLTLAAGVNVLASFVPWRVDLTDSGRNTLSPVTLEVLERLPAGMQATAFFPATPAWRPAREAAERLLATYRRNRPDLAWQVVDPEVAPGEARRLGVSEYGSIVFSAGERHEQTTSIDERAFTEALMQAGGLAEKKVCIVADAGGPELADTGPAGLARLGAGLRRELFQARRLGVADSGGDCAVLALIGLRDLPAARLAAIRTELEAGSALLLLADPDASADIRGLSASFGLRVGEGQVTDPSTHLGNSDTTPAVQAGQYPQTALTGNLATTYFPGVAPVVPVGDAPDWPGAPAIVTEGLASPVAVTTAAASVRGGAGSGRLALGAMAVQGGRRAVVFGDSDFATNAHIFNGGNGDLLLNAVRWLAEARPLTDIRPRPYAYRRLVLDARQQRVLAWTATALLPGLALLVALGLWWRRR